MKEGDRVNLKQEVKSYYGVVFGRTGEEVIIVADHQNVMIVQDKSGKRFSVETDQLTTDQVQIVDEPKEVLKPISAPGPKRKGTSRNTQSNLF